MIIKAYQWLCILVLLSYPGACKGIENILGSHGKAICHSALDCQLNGVCLMGTCTCSQGWIGARCQHLKLSPAVPERSRATGYKIPDISSWGASVVQGIGEQYFMFVTEMANHCGLTGAVCTCSVHLFCSCTMLRKPALDLTTTSSSVLSLCLYTSGRSEEFWFRMISGTCGAKFGPNHPWFGGRVAPQRWN